MLLYVEHLPICIMASCPVFNCKAWKHSARSDFSSIPYLTLPMYCITLYTSAVHARYLVLRKDTLISLSLDIKGQFRPGKPTIMLVYHNTRIDIRTHMK